MTGAFVRIRRDGRWQNIEFDQLTDTELDELETRSVQDGWTWAKFLARWIRDNVKEGSR